MSLLNACLKALVLRAVTFAPATDGENGGRGGENGDDAADARHRAGLFKPGRNRLARTLFLAAYLAATSTPALVVAAADHGLEVRALSCVCAPPRRSMKRSNSPTTDPTRPLPTSGCQTISRRL